MKNSIKWLIISVLLTICSSCTWLTDHPKVVQDIEQDAVQAGEGAINDAEQIAKDSAN